MDEFQINSWSQWFEMCGEILGDVNEYQDRLWNYVGMTEGKNDRPGEYRTRHPREFWVGSSPFTPYVLKNCGMGFVIVFVVIFIAWVVWKMITGFGTYGFSFDILALHAKTAAIIGVLVAILGVLLGFGIYFLRRSRAIKWFSDMGDKLAPKMKYIPPKYRNAFCIDGFYHLYADYGVDNFNHAMNTVDAYVRENAGNYVPVHILYDVPYSDSSSDTKPGGGADDDPAVNNPALPSDIKNHTREGVEDAEAALDEMIGLENVKDQVRQMKRRIEFYGGSNRSNSGSSTMLLGPAGSGKALADDTLIPVVDSRGYVRISDLRVGDFVFDENGHSTRVLGVYHQGVIPAYEIGFEDGSSLICNDEHMFAVRKMKSHKNNGPFVDMNVHQMMTDGVTYSNNCDNRLGKYWIPLNGALERPAVNLPIDPYALGALIGDGCLHGNAQLTMSSIEPDIVNEVAFRLGSVAEKCSGNNHSWIFNVGNSSMSLYDADHIKYISCDYLARIPELSGVFGKYCWEKRIPDIYFTGSIEQRMLLLQGLMDTDGSVSSNYRGTCSYTTTSEGLAIDIKTLVTSLGMRCRINGPHIRKDRPNCKPTYQLTIMCEHSLRPNLFLRSAKRQRCIDDLSLRANVKPNRVYHDVKVCYINNLHKDVSMTCIYVDAPSHLYQAGLSHIVTHNTEIARILTRLFYDFGYIKKNRIVEVDGEYLKSPYVGQTGERTSAIVDWAMGGVLFVDEAYLLFNEKDNSSVGAEATGVLLKAMEDHRDELVVIFAGYEDNMNRLIASNEGFASRIKYKIYFDTYSAEELTQIFDLFLKKSGQHVDKIDADARDLLKAELDAESKLPGFGNARSARNACDALLDIHADRYIDGKTVADKKDTITLGDVEAFVEIQKKKMAADGRNFMATTHLDESIMSMQELKSRTKRGVDDWEKALDGLIGLDTVKQEIRAFKERSDFFANDALAEDDLTLNLQFVGPAGSGKTTAAAIVTKMFYDAGYIRENRYLDISGDFLKGSYVGQTGKRTEAVIEYSKGMVLFIDEAYLLNGEGTNNFGAEAVGVLVNAMEKNRGELVVIFAGYEREMSLFMGINSGLSSRIATTMHFGNYTIKELMMIFAKMAVSRGFKVEKAAWPRVKEIAMAAMNDPYFGNARFMRQMLQSSISTHASRWARHEIDDANRYVIEYGDITNPS